MYLVSKTYGHNLGLSACFRQPKAKSHCRFLHGYALAFTFVFGARQLDENNWVKDFGSLKPLKARLVDHFDHKLLVAQDDPARSRLEDLMGVLHPELDRPMSIALADVLVVPAVGCEAFARMAWGWSDELITPEERERGVHLRSVECREHGANSATYTGAN